MDYQYLGRKTRYEAHAFNVSQMHVRLPDGREREYDLVEHPDSVTIVPVDDAGNIYFVSQHRVGAGGLLLELPAGVVEDGESPLICARREIREEIGKAAGAVIELGGFYLAPGYANEYMTVFLGKDLSDSPLAPDADEFLNVVVMPVAEAFRRAAAGEMHDSKTLASLLLAQDHLIKGK